MGSERSHHRLLKAEGLRRAPRHLGSRISSRGEVAALFFLRCILSSLHLRRITFAFALHAYTAPRCTLAHSSSRLFQAKAPTGADASLSLFPPPLAVQHHHGATTVTFIHCVTSRSFPSIHPPPTRRGSIPFFPFLVALSL